MSSTAPPPTPPASVIPLEVALIERARRGDASSFREIFRQHGPHVWRFLRDLLGAPTAADEATQETFVRAHTSLTSGAPIERLLPWLLGVARNVAREHLRARSRTVPMASPVEDTEPEPAPDPEALLAGRETGDALARAMASLAEDRRAVLALRVDHDLSYEEIATVLGWPVLKVRNEIHRARRELRAALADHLNVSENANGS